MNEKTTSLVDEVEMHGPTVKRFQSLCDMHRVPFGEPDNLNDLVTSLQQNRHFAMDFWAIAGELSVRERGALSDEEMLEVVVAGASNLTLEAAERDYGETLYALRQMLAGVDVAAPNLPPPVVKPQEEAFSSESPEKLEQLEQLDFAQKVLRRREEQYSSKLNQARSSDTVTQAIADALQRLERSNRELQEQLSAMKQEKILPASESEKPRAAKPENVAPVEPPIQQAQAPRIVEVPAVSEREIFAPRSRRSLSRRGLILSDPDDDPSIHVPLATYSEDHPRSKVVRIGIPAVLLLLAVAGWFAINRGYGRQMVERYTPWAKEKWNFFQQEVQGLVGKKQQQNPAANQPASSPTSQSSPAPVTPAPTQLPASDNATQAASPEVQKPAESLAVPQQQSAPTRGASSSTPIEQVTSQNALAFDELQQGAVRVSSSTMEDNLMVSRVPVYPEAAKARGIEGPVQVEVVISPSGAVEAARAIRGDPHLYAAAEESVMKWRYKPYLLNGRPVKAVTQVRVIFRLPE
ncbi:energy transducer TonB [Edaphobacter albus]|uniref:energy transducer TonB n=1 Tax=Edaphobacter sp. 4G125 TaxID=2763071 RepID=UPI0016451C8C|nr:energy transducer TonB [Edaphobacter sp. 4G125]QNI37066.1 energy transducer TonB [Edaphobacter sp. 4G125]